VADSLASYVECNTDEMNQLKSLALPDDPDDDQDNLSGDENGAPAGDQEEEKKSNDDEPKIEDIIDSKIQITSSSPH
jgi:hypothetical protein